MGFVLLSHISSQVNAVSNISAVTATQLLADVSATGAFEHLEAFQKIANESNGNRAAGTIGHERSANYVAQQLLAAGYLVEYHPFRFKKFSQTGDPTLKVLDVDLGLVLDKDFAVMSYSGSGEAIAQMTAVDVALGLGNTTTSGCEADDFKDFPKGNIAVIQRGTCAFGDKAKNAEEAGAAGVIIFNQGNTEDRKELFVGTLGEDVDSKIPVLATSYDIAVKLIEMNGVKAHLIAQTRVDESVSFNVIAESRTGNPDNVVMLGSHLDGVEEGPGINDNGSGSAGILEVALKMKNMNLNNKLRFAWWSAEELGLIGSTKYVESLTDAEKAKIALYLNFDMIASPNYIIGVYDGDGSKFGSKGPEGSGPIEQLFHMFYGLYGKGSVETEFSGRSDYQAFALAGIAVGGTFTGAEAVKTKEEAKLFGGEEGVAYDVCYHKECDSLKNVNKDALEINTDAIAYMALTYGHSTASLGKKATMRVMTEMNRVKSSDVVSISCHEEAFVR